MTIDWNFKPIYIGAVSFFIKTAIELILIADVNSKVNSILNNIL